MQDNKNEKPEAPRKAIRGASGRLLWTCAIIGLVAALVVIWVFGVSLWTAIIFVLLIGCPAGIGWLLLIDQQSTRGKP